MAKLDRIRWQCRRGLLELDLILQEFNRRHLAGLDPGQLELFTELLELPDNDLLDLAMGRALRLENPLYRRRRRRPDVPRLSDRAAHGALRFSRVRVSDPLRRAPKPESESRVRLDRDASPHGARAAVAFLFRLPPRRPPNGGTVRRGRRAVGVLSRFAEHQRSAAS